MINYAVLHDTRSLMLRTLNDEIKLKFSPWAWLIGIQNHIYSRDVPINIRKKIKENNI